MNEPCMCGAEDCKRCHPEFFRGGQYMDPDRYCDQCQRFADSPTTACPWCGMQVCDACEGEHMETCGKDGGK